MKRKLYPLFYCLAFISYFTTCAYAQNTMLSKESLTPKTSVNWARDNYVAPQETSAKEQTETDIDPNGPWMICDIQVDGLKNIRKKTITKNIAAKIGHLYEKSSIQDDAASLMALGNFEDIQIDISAKEGSKINKADDEDANTYPCHTLTLIIKEKPILEKILYKGRKKLSKSTITGAMALKVKDPYSQAKMEADIPKITEAYSQRGYINAKVSFTEDFDPEQNTVTITLVIDEGTRTKIKEVLIEGAEKLNQKKFLKQTKNRAGKVFKEQLLPQDQYKATLYARNEGFYDFKITDFTPEFNEDKSEVVLKYKVNEGPNAVFGKTTFTGNTLFTQTELDNMVFYKEGKRFNQQKFDATIRDMQENYANKGFLRAQIQPVRKLNEDSTLDIDFEITENNTVFIDHIDITGNESTKTYIFAREVPFKEGDIFSYEKIRRGQSKIMNLGFVNDAQIDITPTNDINKVDVGYNIVEGRPGMFTAGVAMSSLDGLYGDVSVTHMNLFGKAQRLSVRALFGKRILDYTLSWSTPWIFDRPVSFGVDLFNTRRYRSFMGRYSAYTEKQQGGRINIGPRFNDDIYNLGFSYTFKNLNIYDIDSDFVGIDKGLVEGRTNISTLGTSFAIDTRDNYWDPTSGARNSIGLELSGGPVFGDLDIYQINLKSSYSKTLINIGKDYPIVLMIANRAGIVRPYGRTDIVPAYERIFLGGADTVRGYDNTGQIGPETGGELYYMANIELKFPLAREGRRTIAQLAAFFDIGNSWNKFDEIKLKTGKAVDEFKMGVGLGLRLVTPTLPIRLDWGYGLNHQPGEKRGYIYFSMANLF